MGTKIKKIISKFEKKQNGEFAYRGTPCFIYFYATWCRPCQFQSLVINELYKKYNKFVEFYKIDIDEDRISSEFFSVISIPTMFMCTNNGVKRIIGYTDMQTLKSIMDEHYQIRKTFLNVIKEKIIEAYKKCTSFFRQKIKNITHTMNRKIFI